MMKLMIAALIASQVLGAAQATAGIIESDARVSAQQAGAFAGGRLRVTFGGKERGRVRAGLALAPSLHHQRSDGSLRTRYGDGLELSLTGQKDVRLTLAGRPVSQLVTGGQGPEAQKQGVSTLGWIAIGVGAAALLYVAAMAVCIETNCFGSE